MVFYGLANANAKSGHTCHISLQYIYNGPYSHIIYLQRESLTGRCTKEDKHSCTALHFHVIMNRS
jgi:hypothetical protein